MSETPLNPTLDRIVLPVRKGHSPGRKPPVRIFLGTEAAQQRAERVFVWSIEQVRDPGREVEITLMRDLPGFSRRGWTTGFTNYRFAIPDLAGGVGRAIYNDVDQIYLSDPGELFDRDLGGHGYLAVSPTDTSVMLLDCARMRGVWNLATARRHLKRTLLERARRAGDLYGALPAEWNARDAEFRPGASKVLHYTTLHQQPWRPFPAHFVYYENPQARRWFDLEAAADEAGFQVFTPEHPSGRFRAMLAARPGVGESGAALAAPPTEFDAPLTQLVERAGAATLLEVVPGQKEEFQDVATRFHARELRRVGLASVRAGQTDTRADGVVCLGGLDQLPAEDAPWVIDLLFQRAGRFIFAAIDCAPRPRRPGAPALKPDAAAPWWVRLFDQAARRRPELHWEIGFRNHPEFPGRALSFRMGGAFLGDAPPSVWVLSDGKPGHTTQSIGLAEELGWPFETKPLSLGRAAELPNPLLGASVIGVQRQSRALLMPPWPDLLLACGRRLAPVARWVRRQSRGRTRIVQIGRKGSDPAARFDLSVVPSYARSLAHPDRIEIVAPPSRVQRDRLEGGAARWKEVVESAPSPRIGVLVGGDSRRHRFTPELAVSFGRDVMDLARSVGGSIFATTSRRTPTAAADRLSETLRDASLVYVWRDGAEQNPYLGLLALADALIVTGDSASMLAEACATEKPVLIYPLPRRDASFSVRWVDAFCEAVVRRALARPRNRRGTTRPQKRLERWCALLLDRGVVRPPPDLERLHRALVERGSARVFSSADALPEGSSPCDETARVAERVRQLLGSS